MGRIGNDVRMSWLKPRILGLTLVAAAWCLCASSAWSADWPHFRGPARDGKSADTGLLQEWSEGGPKLAWAKEDLGHGYSSVSVVGDTLYITGLKGETGYMYALDANGGEKWRVAYGPDWKGDYAGTRSTPTIYKGMIYIMSSYGRVVCLDVKTGEEKWAVDTIKDFGARNIPWGLTESLLVEGDKLICTPGGAEVGMVALDRHTGKTIWTCKEIGEKSAYCSPVLIRRGQRAIVVTLTAKSLLGVDFESGKLIWKTPHPVKSDIQAVAPVYEDGRFYVSSGSDGKKRGLMLELSEDGATITRKWTDSKLDWHHGGVIVHEGHIYGGGGRNNRGKWVCMELKTGKVIAEIEAVGKGSIAYADGKFYGYGENGSVGLINSSPADFRMISSFKMTKGEKQHWAHPVIANGRLYIRHGRALMAYDIKAQ